MLYHDTFNWNVAITKANIVMIKDIVKLNLNSDLLDPFEWILHSYIVYSNRDLTWWFVFSLVRRLPKLGQNLISLVSSICYSRIRQNVPLYKQQLMHPKFDEMTKN